MSERVTWLTKAETFHWLYKNRDRIEGLNNFAIQTMIHKATGKAPEAVHIRLWSNEAEGGGLKSFAHR